MADSLRERLIVLVEPLLQGLGYELVDIEYAPGRSDAMLRVYIDWPGGIAPVGVGHEADEDRSYEGIGVEDCARVSHAFSDLMDVEDPIPVAYTLEVSSPGVDRILRTPAHFVRFAGERVHVELAWPRDGRKRYTGQMSVLDETGIELNVDGEPVTIKLDEIAKARVSPDWSRSPPRKEEKG
jgi:ribosome maturation factor RimP